ncbi:MAG TPA: phosphatase PAP2 family protein [Intrasporangium sp.]|nr:phosphatase PAP2 family protein [Intrasporangium sp.]
MSVQESGAAAVASQRAEPNRSPALRLTGLVLLLSLAGFAGLTIAVGTGAARGLDERIVEFFRPHGYWGDLQIWVDVIVEGLRPLTVAALTAACASVAAVRLRSWWPLACTGLTFFAGTAMALAVKLALARPDVSGEIGGVGGSFPSGHVVAVLLAAGCVVLMGHWGRPWLAWAFAGVVGGVMGWALIVQAAHWFTDVLAAVLLSVTVLVVARLLPWHSSRDVQPPNRAGRPRLNQGS